MSEHTENFSIYISGGEVLNPREAVQFRIIGSIITPYTSMEACPSRHNQNELLPCRIQLEKEFRPGLDGLNVGDQVLVLYWLHLARRDLVQLPVRPGGRTKPLGVFATRTPPRPNPIAAAVAEVLEQNQDGLEVLGLDCLNGTPLLDIKKARFYPKKSGGSGLS
jgi:tRNA-Thr(GGU) m(6)t(6)A37 methyltransferase TsaA